MDVKRRRRWGWLVKGVITVTLLVWVVRLADPQALSQTLGRLDMAAVAWALAALALAYVIAFFRWGILLRCVGMHSPLRTIVPEYLLSMFYNHVLPSSVGGDAVRAYYLTRRGFDLHAVVASTVVDRLLGLAGVVLMSTTLWVAIAATLQIGGILRFGPVIAVLACMGLLIWVARRMAGALKRTLAGFGSPRVRELLLRLFEALENYAGHPIVSVNALILSIASQCAIVFAYVSLGQALHIEMSWLHYFFVVPSVMFMQILPISFAGMGVREAGLVGLLALLGVDTNQAVALSIAYLAVFWLSVIPGAGVALWYFMRRPREGKLDKNGQTDAQ